MKKLRSIHALIKIALIIASAYLSYSSFQTGIDTLGYASLFTGLFIIFEGFGLSLFLKILIALILGCALPLSNLFTPEQIIAIKPVGSKIFMNCLTMALVPLVFASILTGVTSLGDLTKLNRIGLKTIIYYVTTTAIAITIGLTLANIMQPGQGLSPEIKAQFQSQYSSTAENKVLKAKKNKQTLFETVQQVFPKNIMESVSLAKPQMLQLIFFAIICGIALLQIDKKYSEPVIALCYGITEMTVKIITMVMRIAPYGVFALIASTIAQSQSIDLILSLIPFSICVLLGLTIHLFGTNSLSLKFLSRVSVSNFFKQSKSVAITAFSTASSGATMPLTLETSVKKLNVKNEVAGFVIPLGATVNMDGTALFQGVSTLFLANIYGIQLGITDQLIVVGMAVMASIGTAAVPGVGIVVLTMILVSVGIPPEGILFILPVNNILDMCRTAVNVVGDMACSVYIDSTESS